VEDLFRFVEALVFLVGDFVDLGEGGFEVECGEVEARLVDVGSGPSPVQVFGLDSQSSIVRFETVDAFDGLDRVRLFNVDASCPSPWPRLSLLMSCSARARRMSPIRFAKRRMMRRRRVKYDSCPSMENIVRSLAEA
jgi:hypothetical protein